LIFILLSLLLSTLTNWYNVFLLQEWAGQVEIAAMSLMYK